MSKLRLLKDLLTTSDKAKHKADSRASFEHKAGKRNYNSNAWKDLCYLEDSRVKP